LRKWALVALLVAVAAPAYAQTPPPEGTEPIGPLIVIEDIEVVGNRSTQAEIIVRALPIGVGDELRAGDPRLREARYKLLALGFFRDVTLGLRKGEERGHVVLTVTVVERGTVVLNRLWFGNSTTSPWWLGADVGERNLLGTGLAVGGGVVYADDAGEIPDARPQWAGEVRIADPSLYGSAYGFDASFTWVHGSEPFRIAGGDNENSGGNFDAFSFQRNVVRGGLTWDLTALAQVTGGLRLEAIDAAVPTAPTRELPDGRVVGVDLFLRPGSSQVISLDLGFDHDTRSDPVLPRSGRDFALEAELGSTLFGGSYDFFRLLARYEHWWPVGADGAIAARLAGGIVVGDAPRFERIHVGDVNRMLEPRALGLVVSGETSPDILGTGTGGIDYGELGGSAMLEYSRRLFRRPHRIYGGDWFVGAGLWGLANRDDLALRDAGAWRSLPIDLVLDAGIRLDTEIGIFELTVANALGRAPI
jgi:outer membrane protein assembly factor BamA